MLDQLGVPVDSRLVFVCAAVFVGGFMRGFVGFGAALVTVPALSLVYGPRLAVAAAAVMAAPSLIQLLPDAIRHSERALVLPLSTAILAAAPFGTWALVTISPAVMKIAISALVLAMVAMLARGWRLGSDVGLPLLSAAGIASGLIQGAAGMGGPPVVGIVISRPGTTVQQRGNVLALMTAVSISSLLPQWYFGLFTRQAITVGLILLPVYGGSIMFGARYFARGGAGYYRRAALATLAAIGVVTFVVAVKDYALS